jgi:hypothetical protein
VPGQPDLVRNVSGGFIIGNLADPADVAGVVAEGFIEESLDD